MTARSVGSEIDEGDPAEPECPLFCRYRGKTGRSADFAATTQMTRSGRRAGGARLDGHRSCPFYRRGLPSEMAEDKPFRAGELESIVFQWVTRGSPMA